MLQTILSDKLWLKLQPILLDLNIYDKPNLRNIFTGILYRARTGCQWRYLPEIFGKYNTVFKAFRRWSKSDKFLQLFKILVVEPDMEWISIDDTHIRAHQSSAGAAGKAPQAIAKSVGGNSTKIHLAVDAHGNPLDFLISDGVTHDIKMAPKLLGLLDLSKTAFLNADRGYDCMELRDSIGMTDTQANIPKKKNSLSGNKHMDWIIYGSRHVVENTFCTLKHFRGLASRFDKLQNSYTNVVALVCAYIWLKL